MTNQNTFSSATNTASDNLESATRSTIIAQSLAVLVLGAVMLFAVGFAPMEAAHNAAHDTRHSAAFPCH